MEAEIRIKQEGEGGRRKNQGEQKENRWRTME